MPAAELVRNRREGKPLSSRVADGSKNSNIRRKLNHKEQIAKSRVKFQQARRGQGATHQAAADLRAERQGLPSRGGEEADLRAFECPLSTDKSLSLIQLGKPVFVLYMFTLSSFFLKLGLCVDSGHSFLKI
jgi:hypothetical protein